jgi:RNA polymerase sigma-70 factor (ECF subfamily)
VVYTGVIAEAVTDVTPGEAAASPVSERVARLFDTHHQRLYRLARRMSPNADDAKDLLQETFLRVVRASSSVPVGASSEEAWLVRIMVNACRTRWHQKATRSRLDALHARGDTQLATANPEAALVSRSVVWHALSQLAPRRRAVIVMCELEGLAVSTVATQLGVAAVTVRWHLSRGRRELLHVMTRTEGGRK